MATASPSLLVAINQSTQDLFEISFPFDNVPQYDSVGTSAIMKFPTTLSTVGTDISINSSTGIVTLAAGKTYKIEARAFSTLNSKQNLSTYIALTSGGNLSTAISFKVPMGEQAVAFITTTNSTTIAVGIVDTEDSDVSLTYPTQIEKAGLAVQVVDGFTVV